MVVVVGGYERWDEHLPYHGEAECSMMSGFLEDLEPKKARL